MNFESVENVRSLNVVEFEFELRHIPSANGMTATRRYQTHIISWISYHIIVTCMWCNQAAEPGRGYTLSHLHSFKEPRLVCLRVQSTDVANERNWRRQDAPVSRVHCSLCRRISGVWTLQQDQRTGRKWALVCENALMNIIGCIAKQLC